MTEQKAAYPPVEERFPWRVRCDSCGWVDHFATKEQAETRAARHADYTSDRFIHQVRVVRRDA